MRVEDRPGFCHPAGMPSLAAQVRQRFERSALQMMGAWSTANIRHGSLIQAWVRGQAMVEHTHYPKGDVIDRKTGSQYFYHAHRSQGGEHGHLHLFWHATAGGARRRNPVFRRTAPSHLFALSLDARGLPEAIFTTNLWVTGGYWFDAATVLSMIDRFRVARAGRYAAADQWLNHFIPLYRDAIALALHRRDARVRQLTRRRSWAEVSQDARHEILSSVAIDLPGDLAAIDRWATSQG